MSFDPTDKIEENGNIVDHESSGGFLFFKDGKVLFVALVKKKGLGYFIPKGHIKHGESPEDAAIREIKEELGVSSDFKLQMKSEIIRYEFRLPDDERQHKKKVHLFVFESEEKSDLASEGGEFEDPKWLTVEEATKLLEYDHSSLDRAVKLFEDFKAS